MPQCYYHKKTYLNMKKHTLNTEILIEVISSIIKNQILEKDYSDDVLRKIIFKNIKNINHTDRDNIAEDVAKKLSIILKEKNINSSDAKIKKSPEQINQHVDELNKNGITMLGEVLSEQQVSDIFKSLKNKPVFNGHVWDASDKKEYKLDEVRENFPQASHMLKDTIDCPHLLELMSSPDIAKITEKYLGATPKLYSSNLMWSFGKHHDPKKGVARLFHRDIDNFNFCVLFIFLTDVKKGSGSHQYIKKTHKRDTIQQLLLSLKDKLNDADYTAALNYLNSDKLGEGYVDNEILPLQKIEELFKDDMLEVEGKAGHAFLADPYGLHRGVPVISDDRLLFWGRFSLFDNGFSSSASPHKIDWKNVENRIDSSDYNKYMLSPILCQNGEDKELINPDVKRLKENIFIGNTEEVAAGLLKNLGTKNYTKNFFNSLIKHKKNRLTK